MTAELRLVTYQELAVAWKVSVRTVQRWIAQDLAQGYRIRRTCRGRPKGRGRLTVLPLVDAEALMRRRFPSLF